MLLCGPLWPAVLLIDYLCNVSFLLYAILAYILYQFIFKLVIPVYKASRQIKKGFREMNSRMQQKEGQQQSSESRQSKPASKPRVGEYIDFEEVK